MIAVADVLATLQSPVTLRFAHEMDDKSGQFIWSDWNPDDYIAAYRRMTDVARDRAPKINLMWSPLGDENMGDYYPGDDYADIVGLTVFGLQAWDQAKFGRDQTFDDIFAPATRGLPPMANRLRWPSSAMSATSPMSRCGATGCVRNCRTIRASSVSVTSTSARFTRGPKASARRIGESRTKF